ncbi:lipase 1-like [Anthonomus grandis grandis]|uniref:lipase 1-like n=1 Tax=Anthonomus grandis grandis TaxID=2921223 RepID=UPI002166598E|nr:lipase 1-like [Anthonomus grandis grandis]
MILTIGTILNSVLLLGNNIFGKYLPKSRTTVELLKDLGYSSETHQVQTEDGYLLTLHRIPYQRDSARPYKGPILLGHGVLCSSADWIVNGNQSLGIILAQNGYDVWMGNNRGNTYSRRHVSLDPEKNSKEFFAFSYHEMGKYDLPAMVDYVLKHSNVLKIPYVGFSEGATQFWVMMSERPQYNDKISMFTAWAPVTDMYMITQVIVNYLARHPIYENLFRILGIYEIFSHRTVGNTLRLACRKSESFCNFLFHLCGQSWERMPNKILKDKILENFFAGISLKQAVHYVQGARSGVFRPFDFGHEKNLKIYGKTAPNPYNISATQIPVVLYYGDSDVFVNIAVMKRELVNVLKDVKAIELPYTKFNHLDFIYGTNVQYLTDTTLNNIKNIV